MFVCWGDSMKKIILYHGSNVEVSHPKILDKLRALDFGAGFYLTSSKNQAEKWAKTVTKRRKTGNPILNIYEFDKKLFENLKILKFDTADGEWLDFVVANRKDLAQGESYDLVIGPVANDSTLPVIDDYMDGRYTKQQAVERLMPQNLTDQYAFLTTDALNTLSFIRSEML
jgi:hypothetical protein